MLSITYFYREARKTGVSIEGIFKLVKQCLENEADIKEFFCDGDKSRLQNTLAARSFSNDINHITGDVNFLVFGLIGRKNILTIHDLGHYDTLKKRNFISFLIYKYLWYQYPLMYIDLVTVVSQFTKDKLVEYFRFPEERIRIIKDPIKPVFKFAPKNTLNTPPRVLMMGTGIHKNLNNLIEAVKGSDLHIDIIGWPSGEELKKINQYGISHTIYNKLTDDEVYKRYQECDIMYNASFYEGFGMPIIEAQSVGRPVITSNLGAMKEVAGNSAILVDPYDPQDTKKAIMKLVNDRIFYNAMVKLGSENIAPYQYQSIAKQYLDVYKEVALLKK
jgi:glycosyltransferase involved in cell wall biosynthesis